MNQDEDLIYQKAKKKVKAKKEFYKHLSAYVSVISVLAIINIFTSPFHFWFIYPAMGWGIAIVFQYFDVFGIPGIPSGGNPTQEWEEEEIEKEVNRMRRTKRYSTPPPSTDEVVPELEEDIVPDPPAPEDELELKEFKKLRKDWDDTDFV